MVPIFMHFKRLPGLGHHPAQLAADRGGHVPGLHVVHNVAPDAAPVITLRAAPDALTLHDKTLNHLVKQI